MPRSVSSPSQRTGELRRGNSSSTNVRNNSERFARPPENAMRPHDRFGSSRCFAPAVARHGLKAVRNRCSDREIFQPQAGQASLVTKCPGEKKGNIRRERAGRRRFGLLVNVRPDVVARRVPRTWNRRTAPRAHRATVRLGRRVIVCSSRPSKQCCNRYASAAVLVHSRSRNPPPVDTLIDSSSRPSPTPRSAH